MKNRPLLVVALESEIPLSALKGWPVILTGVGKINASYHLSKAISEHRPSAIINYGTAGAVSENLSGIVEVKKVIQCDMDVRPLGLALGSTPFDECPAEISLSEKGVICGTADRFADTPPELPCDIVDMELFALAKVAYMEKIPLQAFKFISDNADEHASKEWQSSLSSAAQAFLSLKEKLGFA